MKLTIFLLLIFVTVTLFVGCAASTPTSEITGSLVVGNETGNVITSLEIRSGNEQTVVKPDNIPVLPGEKRTLVFPFMEGLNYVVATQGGKISKKKFLVQNGDIVELAGSKKFLDKIIFLPYDFQ